MVPKLILEPGASRTLRPGWASLTAPSAVVTTHLASIRFFRPQDAGVSRVARHLRHGPGKSYVLPSIRWCGKSRVLWLSMTAERGPRHSRNGGRTSLRMPSKDRCRLG